MSGIHLVSFDLTWWLVSVPCILLVCSVMGCLLSAPSSLLASHGKSTSVDLHISVLHLPLSESFFFLVEREKSVAFVSSLLMVTHQFFAHAATLSRASCILYVDIVAYSSKHL